jgi:carbamoyltransferase
MEVMRDFLRCNGDGQYRLNPALFIPLKRNMEECVNAEGEFILPRMYSDELVRRAGPPRERGAGVVAAGQGPCRSCQLQFEEVVLACLRYLHGRVPSENLVTAGGCALNGVCNARILRETPFRRLVHSRCRVG